MFVLITAATYLNYSRSLPSNSEGDQTYFVAAHCEELFVFGGESVYSLDCIMGVCLISQLFTAGCIVALLHGGMFCVSKLPLLLEPIEVKSDLFHIRPALDKKQLINQENYQLAEFVFALDTWFTFVVYLKHQ